MLFLNPKKSTPITHLSSFKGPFDIAASSVLMATLAQNDGFLTDKLPLAALLATCTVGATLRTSIIGFYGALFPQD